MTKLMSYLEMWPGLWNILIMTAQVDIWCEGLLISLLVLGSVFRWFRLGPPAFGPDCCHPSAIDHWLERLFLVMVSAMFMAASTPVELWTYLKVFFIVAFWISSLGGVLGSFDVLVVIKCTEADLSRIRTIPPSVRSPSATSATTQAVEEWRDTYCLINEPMVHAHNGDCEGGSDSEYHLDGFYWRDICEAQTESVLFIRDEKFPDDMIPILKDADNRMCTICLERHEHGDSVTVLPCNHAFGKGCLEQWMIESMTCPKCRRKFKWQLTSAE